MPSEAMFFFTPAKTPRFGVNKNICCEIDDGTPEKFNKTMKRAIKLKEISKDKVKPNEVKEGSFYAFQWDSPQTYYWGRVEKLFCDDEDDDPSEVEVTFLKRCTPSSNTQALR